MTFRDVVSAMPKSVKDICNIAIGAAVFVSALPIVVVPFMAVLSLLRTILVWLKTGIWEAPTFWDGASGILDNRPEVDWAIPNHALQYFLNLPGWLGGLFFAFAYWLIWASLAAKWAELEKKYAYKSEEINE